MDPFLTRDEKRQVQKMYEHWNKYAKPVLFVDKLVSNGMLHEREHQEFSAKSTEYERNRYLYDAVISRSTYDRICKLRDILYDLEDRGHTALADMLPRRQDSQSTPEHEMQWDAYSNRHQHYESYPDYKNTGYGGYNVGGDVPYMRQDHQSHYQGSGYQAPPQQPYQTQYQAPPPEPQFHQAPPPEPQFHQAPPPEPPKPEPKYEVPPDDQYDPKYAYGHKPRTENMAQQSSGSASAPPRQQKQSKPERQDKKKRLNVYPTRPNNPESGKGLCVIIANFTDDLLGYLNDIGMITQFFGETLKYTVLGGDGVGAIGYRDLTTDECWKKIRWLKTELENGKYKMCDRFFLFVLSHGDEDGIKMIPPNDKRDNPVRDRIKSEDLVDNFAHDQLPNLKGYPKCFFIQVCSGAEIAKAAHSSTTEEEEKKKKAQVVAVGADTLVCQAAKHGKYSWVSQGDKAGSWFLQASLKVFKEYHQEEHILDMLTEVNDRVSKKQGLSQVTRGNQKVIESVYQLPAVSNNLTKKLYLE